MKIVGKSERGTVREKNQDSFLLLRADTCTLAVVCDGIGGGKAGEVASKTVVDQLKKSFMKRPDFASKDDMKKWFLKVIQDANRQTALLARSHEEYQGMGTTMVANLCHKQWGIIGANVGDSRIYGLSLDNRLVLLSIDHSYVNELIKHGQIDEKEALHHPYRHVLTNAMGISPTINVDIFEIDNVYSKFLLCSDGLHGYVSEDLIYRVLKMDGDIDLMAQQLIDLANQVGGFDNVTVIIIDNNVGESYE